jgi:hypothetical protein
VTVARSAETRPGLYGSLVVPVALALPRDEFPDGTKRLRFVARLRLLASFKSNTANKNPARGRARPGEISFDEEMRTKPCSKYLSPAAGATNI